MSEFVWVTRDIAEAVHDRQLAEHGGSTGIRDVGMLESALARPQNLLHYGEPDLAAMAAAYAFGIARNSFEFEARKGAPAPAVWDAGRVAEVVSGADAVLAECRGTEQGRLLVTLYIGEGGKALAGGAASEEPVGEEAVDCVVNALLAADYPPPERSPTKVRFQL